MNTPAVQEEQSTACLRAGMRGQLFLELLAFFGQDVPAGFQGAHGGAFELFVGKHF